MKLPGYTTAISRMFGADGRRKAGAAVVLLTPTTGRRNNRATYLWTAMSDIFVSFEKSDLPKAEMLADVLTEQGWSVFWDRTIAIGSTWRETIGKELSAASLPVGQQNRSIPIGFSMKPTMLGGEVS